MWSRLYRNHLIMPFPSYDTAAKAWAPQANISWCIGPSRESEFVRFHNRFITEADAVACALHRGETWVDTHLGRLRSRRGDQYASVGGLKRSLGKTGRTKPFPARRLVQWHAEKAFTFGEFKSALAKSGVKLSESTLQKSYKALIDLRQNNHWSWAQTKRKVAHAQQNRTEAQSPEREQRNQQIPLTKRDWRRII